MSALDYSCPLSDKGRLFHTLALICWGIVLMVCRVRPALVFLTLAKDSGLLNETGLLRIDRVSAGGLY